MSKTGSIKCLVLSAAGGGGGGGGGKVGTQGGKGDERLHAWSGDPTMNHGREGPPRKGKVSEQKQRSKGTPMC